VLPDVDLVGGIGSEVFQGFWLQVSASELAARALDPEGAFVYASSEPIQDFSRLVFGPVFLRPLQLVSEGGGGTRAKRNPRDGG
jgi:hypothetical protein